MISVETADEEANFLLNLKALFEKQTGKDSLDLLRKKGWDHFLELGLPSRKSEVFQYVPLEKLYKKRFTFHQAPPISLEEIKKHILPECENSVAVFINGSLDLSLSNFKALPSKVVAIPLQDALRSFGSFINNQVARALQEEIDPFAALNGAFFEKALFLYVPPMTKLETPLQILQIVTGDHQMLLPRVEYFFGALSSATIVSTTAHLDSSNNFLNGVHHFSLEEGAQVCFERVVLDAPLGSWHFDATRAALKKDSKLTTVVVDNGGECYRDDYRASLIGSFAELHLNGVSLLEGKLESHAHVLIEHLAPSCQSLQLFKRAASGFSKSSFEGKIYVDKLAQGTSAFQLNNNLILQEGAQCYSKPNLEIFADDVKASHGATFGSLNEDLLFYLQARGISKEDAKSLLVQGFCLEVIEKLTNKSLLTLGSKKALKKIN